MKLPKFKNFISNSIAYSIFNDLNIYEENLYSKDSCFEVSHLTLPHSTKDEMAIFNKVFKAQKDVAELLNKSPDQDTVMNNDFSFVIHFDSDILGNGISLKNLISISQKLYTDLIFVSGDGNDYQFNEYEGSHTKEVILHLKFIGEKTQILNDYQKWYIERHAHLTKKIEEKSNKNKIKK